MTALTPDTDRHADAVSDEATRWHLRLQESQDSETWRAYQAWLAIDPQHPAAMAEVEYLWHATLPPATDIDTARSAPPVAPRRWRYVASLAASVLFATGLAWLQLGGYDRIRSDAYTSVGEMRHISLDDGSVVMLNTDTALSFDIDDRRREVTLLRGEAYFKVAHDSQRPFIVQSAQGSAQVLGTEFNVRLTPDKARVSVVRGRVAVSSGGANTVLGKGQSAWLHGDALQTEADRDEIAVTSWQRGQIVFYRTLLAEVVAELGRYRRGLVRIHGAALRQMPVSGAFDVNQPDESLRLVGQALGLRTLSIGDWLTVIY